MSIRKLARILYFVYPENFTSVESARWKIRRRSLVYKNWEKSYLG